LLALGGRAVEEVEGWWRTHLPAEPDVADPAAMLAGRLRTLVEPGRIELRVSRQPHEDWAELWKRGLEPRRVGRAFLVTPTWCRPATTSAAHVLVLDPGMAFGNAEHGTTRGCLRLLEDVVQPGDRVLDVGAGSAILSLAAARLGAEHVLALESDAWAIEPARDNIERNGVADRVEVRAGVVDVETLRGLKPVDGVVANIEAGVLLALMPGLADALGPDGWLILSGILDDQLRTVVASAAEQGLALETVDEDGEWRSARFRLVAAS
jgi:ribosomal protein L11 methyltransferase